MSKPKLQVSRTLDGRIKLLDSTQAFASAASHLDILGFHYQSTTNFVGLSTDYKSYNSGLVLSGLVFGDQVQSSQIYDVLRPHPEYLKSTSGHGSYSENNNENLYLIYSKSAEGWTRSIFDIVKKDFVQLKISLIDEDKIYNHSALVRLTFHVPLPPTKPDQPLCPSYVDSLLDNFDQERDRNNISFNVSNTNFSLNQLDAASRTDIFEVVYDCLDAPTDIAAMGDYVPQMSKADTQAMIEKWRNKMRSQRSSFDIQMRLFETSESETLIVVLYQFIQVNDSIYKVVKSLLHLVREALRSVKDCVQKDDAECLISNISKELKFCTFLVDGQLISTCYKLPENRKPDYELLKDLRTQLHKGYVFGFDKPLFRFSQRVKSIQLLNEDQESGLLCNIHVDIKDKSGIKSGICNTIKGTYTYHHYLQDKQNDNGWGCAYRSLQTIISWFKHQAYIYSPDVDTRRSKNQSATISKIRDILQQERRVPSHEEMQTILVDLGDKQRSFIGSKDWIGSQEVCYILNSLFDIDSKFISVSSGTELASKARDLGAHFQDQSTPVMIGGGVLAHTIIGTDFNEKNGDIRYLILDPHYTGGEEKQAILKDGWCGWKKNNFWDKSCFYNLCLPQRPQEY